MYLRYGKIAWVEAYEKKPNYKRHFFSNGAIGSDVMILIPPVAILSHITEFQINGCEFDTLKTIGFTRKPLCHEPV